MGPGRRANIKYTGGLVKDDGVVSSVAITAVVFSRLPHWTQLSKQPKAVQTEWNRMLTALRGHENHHVTIAQSHLNGLPAALNGIHEDDLKTTWQEQMDSLQGAQDQYDTDTTHGQTEGVSLDLSVEPTKDEEESEAAPSE